MNQTQKKWIGLLFAFFAVVLIGTGCMAPQPKPGEIYSCVSASDMTQTISPEASLEDFSCVIKKWEGADNLHFNVTVKNISTEDQRFKVNIFLENGKAVGGLLPRKTNKGLIKPGETSSFSYPVNGMAGSPGKVDLLIKTMSK